MNRKLYLKCISIISLLCMLSCGGGGSGSGQAGDKGSFRVLHSIVDNDSISVSVDGQMTFAQILRGQASIYESVAAGSRLIEVVNNLNPENKLELFNEFGIAIPYTLIVNGRNESLNAIVAVNDRSDTPQGRFRIRAINAKNAGQALQVKLIPATFRIRAAVEATATVTPIIATPTAQATATQIATATVAPEATPAVATEVVIASGLNIGEVSEYTLLTKGDYRIQINSGSQQLYLSEPISYNPNQIESIVISDLSQIVSRLNDKP